MKKNRFLSCILSLSLLFAVFAVSAPTHASAAIASGLTQGGTYNIVNSYHETYLNALNDSNGYNHNDSPVCMWTKDGSNEQKWTLNYETNYSNGGPVIPNAYFLYAGTAISFKLTGLVNGVSMTSYKSEIAYAPTVIYEGKKSYSGKQYNAYKIYKYYQGTYYYLTAESGGSYVDATWKTYNGSSPEKQVWIFIPTSSPW